MPKNNYGSIANYCKKRDIKFAVVSTPTEICPATDFNGFDLVDTETFEIPKCFKVNRALFVCLDTPADDRNYFEIQALRQISRPQYISTEDGYVKLMCWCDWDAFAEDPKSDFVEFCLEAVKSAVGEDHSGNLKFKVDIGGVPILTDKASAESIAYIYDWIKCLTDYDCKLYDGDKFTGHGVRCVKIADMYTLERYTPLLN